MARERSVLVTGAAGNIGATWARHAADRYRLLLLDRSEADLDPVAGCGETMAVDLADLDTLKSACRGVDTVVHLAATPDPSAVWPELLESNITGTYHAFVAAKAAGCRRVVYASSIHAVSGHDPRRQVRTDDPVNPGSLYGVSKCFGEALGRYMAEQEGLSTIAIRIGAFQPITTATADDGPAFMDSFVSHRDMCHLLDRAVEAPDEIRFAIVHGLSDNRFNRLDLSDTRELLGYEPRDDVTELNVDLRRAMAGDLPDHDQSDGLRSGLRSDL